MRSIAIRDTRSQKLSRARVVAALERLNRPVTTLEVATELQANAPYVATVLSRLASHGAITRDKRTVTTADGYGLTYCLWSTP
jgi:predicted transcriptional regulator